MAKKKQSTRRPAKNTRAGKAAKAGRALARKTYASSIAQGRGRGVAESLAMGEGMARMAGNKTTGSAGAG